MSQVRNLASCEAAVESSEASLGKLQVVVAQLQCTVLYCTALYCTVLQVVVAQLQSQHQSVHTSADKISQVRWVLRCSYQGLG